MSAESVTNQPVMPKYGPLTVGEDGKIKTLHHPEGIDPDDIFFDEAKVSDLAIRWRESRDVHLWQQIVQETIPLIDTLILDGGFTDYEELDGLRSECTIKLSRVLEKFDPKRGRAFTIFSISIKHFLISLASKAKARQSTETGIEEEVLENIGSDTFVVQDIADELRERIFKIEVRFHEPQVVNALKYLINYFLAEGFSTSKTKICFTLSQSFQLSSENAYLLYDYALIKLRSTLYELYELDLSPNDVQLLRTHKRWSLVPELVQLIGMPAVKKLVTVFGGVNVTFPSQKDLAKLRSSRAILEQTNEDASYFALRKLSDDLGVDATAEHERLAQSLMHQDNQESLLFKEELDCLQEKEADE